MPGKVNPVIPEVVSQVAFHIAGNDTAIAMAWYCNAKQMLFRLNCLNVTKKELEEVIKNVRH